MSSLCEASFLAIEGENQTDEVRHIKTKYPRELSVGFLTKKLLEERMIYALELTFALEDAKRLRTRRFINR